jgi:hypothetical protein
MTRISKGLSGVAGEYFVAAELSRRGLIASITLRNTRGVDILVAGKDASESAGVQVKTNQGSKSSWILSKKAENLAERSLYYVFVNLNDGNRSPSYHIVPSIVVAKYCKEGHAKWLSQPGRGGHQRKDSDIRNFSDPEGKWRDKWDLLGMGETV